jgi:hypothetical protein
MRPELFSSCVRSWTKVKRLPASGSSKGRSTNANVIRLPSACASPDERTLTGTIARSGSGCASSSAA